MLSPTNGSARPLSARVLSAEAALCVDHLTREPGAVAGQDPGDDRGDVRGPPPAAGGEGGAQALTHFVGGPAGVDRPRIYRVDGNAAVGQFVGEGAGDLVHGALADHVGQLAGHWAQML